ncbi:hypothetical protein BSL78_07888 [Apostichopus japonicus]|uniref:Tenascin-X n=1 Tax=Stichopus japonicus TaxID=307972 RepID=A0A2G8L4J9_STIJA|nr:hypothetical protein BSL78_07888 [Apostichopus japonicus]
MASTTFLCEDKNWLTTEIADCVVILNLCRGAVSMASITNSGRYPISLVFGQKQETPVVFAIDREDCNAVGTLVAHDITIGQNCRLLLAPSGSFKDGSPSHYTFGSITVSDGGEVTTTESSESLKYFTLNAHSMYIQGGGIIHNVEMTINVVDLVVSDLGRLVADQHRLPCVIADGTGKGTSSGASGAGHGGRGGRGSVQKSTGAPFGNIFEPVEFGCSGGSGQGGKGGGKLRLRVTGTMQIDGEVSANGGAGSSAKGGGSGGSIWIDVEHMQGYGSVEVNGGDGGASGSYYGGGGSAGHIAVYFSLNRTFSGSFQAFGGRRGGLSAGDGGPGTAFFYHTRFDHRSLVINNIGRGPGENEGAIEDYLHLDEDEGRAWLLPSSGDMSSQLYGNAHLAALQEDLDASAGIFFENLIGDRTGTLHVGPNQEMDLFREEIDLPFNVRVYEDGHLGLANRTVVHDVTIYLDGALSHVNNLTLHHGGRFWLNHHGHTSQSEAGHYEFDHVHVQDDGYVHMVSDPVEDPSISFQVISLQVDGGGLVEGTHIYVKAENITVDSGGTFRADGLGYRVSDGISTYPNGLFRSGRHGVINVGLGFTGSGGSSGAGHGGSGGHGQGAAKTGLPYSDLYQPEEFGSAGGGTNGGSGGGRIWFNVTDTIHIDGVVSSDGNPGGVGSGGGSGGSIWMHCNLIKGYGTISTNGGDAGSNSGGGAGGRIALNFWNNETSNGFKFESHGGLPDGDWEGGGPGTVFMYHEEHEHRTLYIENGEINPLDKIIDWSNVEEDGCRAWILPVSGTHELAGGNNVYYFEELQIYDGAHLAVVPPGEALFVVDAMGLSSRMDVSFLAAESTEWEVTIFFRHMIGDRTGAIHIADKQEMDLERPEIDLPFSTYVYHDGHLGLAPNTVVHGVEIFNAGLLSHIVNLTLHHGGYLWAQHGGRTAGQPSHHYAFRIVRIQDEASINATTDPIDEPGITFITESIYIEGGGILHGTKLTMISENITIDAGGSLTAEGLGYTGHHSNDTHGEDSLHGDVNLGKPHPVYGLGGGGGHGGSGGRGPNGKAGFAYGDLYEPFLFGSAGGHGLNNQHGGTGGGYVWLNISDTIHIDGELTANGGYADAVGSGGGSAGSVWLHCDTIKGYGRLAVDGGDGYEDNQSPGAGGAGGRLAMYFYKNDTANGFDYHARAGRAGGPLAENGGAGTVFLYHMEYDHRTLIIDNGGLEAWTDHHTLYDYSDWADDGCRTWILSLSGEHHFAGGSHNFHFEELQIYGSAHIGILTDPIGRNASLFFLYMIGDRTGTFHISESQSLDLHRSEIDLPFNVRVYADGFLD